PDADAARHPRPRGHPRHSITIGAAFGSEPDCSAEEASRPCGRSPELRRVVVDDDLVDHADAYARTHHAADPRPVTGISEDRVRQLMLEDAHATMKQRRLKTELRRRRRK